MFPDSFKNLIDNFKKLPGIGEKTAERFAYSIEEMSDDEIGMFTESIIEFKKKIKRCIICGHYSENDICNICSDKSRNHDVICVVEDSKTVFVLEKDNKYNGVYHVLNKLISPINGIDPDDINLEKLVNTRITNTTKEIIIALSSSIEGETTTLYIKNILKKFKQLKISRLSYGIPMGYNIEYVDSLMLNKALEDRKIINDNI